MRSEVSSSVIPMPLVPVLTSCVLRPDACLELKPSTLYFIHLGQHSHICVDFNLESIVKFQHVFFVEMIVKCFTHNMDLIQ